MRNLLRHVSRSFYLTLRVLPRAVRGQLSIAYLLARAADTIADTRLVDIPKRLEALRRLRKCIQEACEGRIPPLAGFNELTETRNGTEDGGTPAERILLKQVGNLLDTLRTFAHEDRRHIRDVLSTIIRGQEMDLIRFGAASENQIVALDTDADLEEYIYCVAGCVGEFWTRICRAYIFQDARLNDQVFMADSVRFGKGLQLVNILRDLPGDLREGRCYIPKDRLASHGMKPADLLDPSAIGRFRGVYADYLQQAEGHLTAGWRYTTMIPFRHIRVRLACAWPILIGVRTVRQLRSGNVLDAGHRIKVSRPEVWSLILRSVLLYPYPAVWKRLFVEGSGRVTALALV